MILCGLVVLCKISWMFTCNKEPGIHVKCFYPAHDGLRESWTYSINGGKIGNGAQLQLY